MQKLKWVYRGLAFVFALTMVAAVASAADVSASGLVNGRDTGTVTAIPYPIPDPLPKDPAWQWKEGWSCDLFGPAEVQGYRLQCFSGTFVDFFVSDGFIPGDHWELKGKNWDAAPNTAVTTSDGGVVSYSRAGRVYNYGGTSTNPKNLDTYVECTYLHGVDVFPASSFILFASDGICTVTPDTVRSRINRTP
jgi:hypothetical protein